jgi:hypothetical protein
LEQQDEDAGGSKTYMGTIVWRQGERYLIKPDHMKCWYQIIRAGKQELERLRGCLDDQLVVDRLLEVEHPHDDESCFCKHVEYKNYDEAFGDIEISHVLNGFYVQAIRKDGIAHKKGVRGGHMVLTLAMADGKVGGAADDNRMWIPLSIEEDLPAFMRPSLECPNYNGDVLKDGLEWPIRLQFHTLPRGWKCVKFRDLESADLEEEHIKEDLETAQKTKNVLSRAENQGDVTMSPSELKKESPRGRVLNRHNLWSYVAEMNDEEKVAVIVEKDALWVVARSRELAP